MVFNRYLKIASTADLATCLWNNNNNNNNKNVLLLFQAK